MKHETAALIVEACENLGIEARLYEGYSGRCMYGKTTTGIVVKNIGNLLPAITRIGMDLAFNDDENSISRQEQLLESLENIQTDDLGRDTIVY